MARLLIAHDLGTGGNKASLYDADGNCLAQQFVPYPTHHPAPQQREQRPQDWWEAVVGSTRALFTSSPNSPEEVVAIGVSGHSLGVVPLDQSGRLLRQSTPIWSDQRAQSQAERFFQTTDEPDWYLTTGNGFPPALYTVFKILWYREHEPDLFARTDKIIGTKDYINYRLTGRIVTDPSYASGSGVYDLLKWDYSPALLEAAELPRTLFPEIVPSTAVVGDLTAEAARELGLPRRVQVVAGGVDNSCMALGARNTSDGRVYDSLGSSSWIAVSAQRPLLDLAARPYVFTHVLPGMFTSAVSIFAAGSSLRWVRDQVCPDLVVTARERGVDAYELMTDLAASSPVGSRGLLFNPSLAGGTRLDGNPAIRGAWLGLDLAHTRSDLIRATMEGVAFGLRLAFDRLKPLTRLDREMVIVGGGSRSSLWRQILADVLGTAIVKTSVDEQAAALGAAALAAVGAGVWSDFSRVDALHRVESVIEPIPANQKVYEGLLPVFQQAATDLAKLGEMTHEPG